MLNIEDEKHRARLVPDFQKMLRFIIAQKALNIYDQGFVGEHEGIVAVRMAE